MIDHYKKIDSFKTEKYIKKVGRQHAHQVLSKVISEEKNAIGIDTDNILYLFDNEESIFVKVRDIESGRPIIAIYPISKEELDKRVANIQWKS